MKIGFDAKRALHNRSGLGNYSRSTLALLSRFYPENKYYLFSARNNFDLFQLSANQSIIEPESKLSTTFPSLWRTWGIRHQIENQKLDIFHGLSNELPFNIKRSGIKYIVTIHDLIFLRYPENYPFIDRQVYTIKFRHACKVADKIIATSESTKQDIICYFGTDPAKIEVVYQTCDPVFSVPVSQDTKNRIRKKYNLPDQYILYLGTIEKRKNALSLIKAYLHENISIPLIIAGKKTAYLDEINVYLNQNTGSERIIFRHAIESVDLPALYQCASVFVYPSVFEGFGIPILEALYSGVPVITSTGSCFAETGGEAALYCNPHDTEELGKLMVKTLTDQDLSKAMIERGLAHAQKFNEESVATNLMNIYLNV